MGRLLLRRPSSPTGRGKRLFRSRFVVLLACWWIAASLPALVHAGFTAYVLPREDPYKVLKIKRKDRNNRDAIKKAYREMAKSAHPDKNRHLDPDVANKRFHRIQEAWEILGDKTNKRKYDQHLRDKEARERRNRRPTKQKEQERRQREKEARETRERFQREQERMKKEQQRKKQSEMHAQEAQEALLRISTLEQLHERSNLFDKNTNTFKKHFLCVFVGNKKAEQTAEKDYQFPYPFGPRGTNSFDWTEIMQTAKVRFNKATPLTRAFRVSARASDPIIVFAKKGSRLDLFEFETYTGGNLEDWVLRMMQTSVSVVNRYASGGPTIKIFFDDGDTLRSAGKAVPPGFMLQIPLKISDRLLVVDAGTDDFTGGVGIGQKRQQDLEKLRDEKILDRIALDRMYAREEGERFDIGRGHGTTRVCYDLSTSCHRDATREKCEGRSRFFHAMCAKSCGVCIESNYWNGIYYYLLHKPLDTIPDVPCVRRILSWLRDHGEFGSVFWHDLSHMWEKRRNIMFGFVFTGLVLGIQIVLLARMFMGNRRSSGRAGECTFFSSPAVVGFLLVANSAAIGARFWLSATPRHKVPPFLRGFRADLKGIEKSSYQLLRILFCLGAVSSYASIAGTRRLRLRPVLQETATFATIVLATALLLLGIDHYFHREFTGDKLWKRHRYMQWESIWDLRKNAAIAIIVSGILSGALIAGLGRFMKQYIRPLYLVLSTANIGLWSGLLLFAVHFDRFFYEDLKHTTEMRMSAAIPCLILGLIWGMGGAHLVSTYRVKVKVD
ncbi:unnamed protein product [Pseudo-nitzschia multistriata]|uniref:J domain-containing protein n=1 Tax=Pseudo-nitzschia multistriata TaxID=183589 RepID=A0A448ZQG3_9STRA|nr:unnamed protein product [Pseudo-nitzschia multistriata]